MNIYHFHPSLNIEVGWMINPLSLPPSFPKSLPTRKKKKCVKIRKLKANEPSISRHSAFGIRRIQWILSIQWISIYNILVLTDDCPRQNHERFPNLYCLWNCEDFTLPISCLVANDNIFQSIIPMNPRILLKSQWRWVCIWWRVFVHLLSKWEIMVPCGVHAVSAHNKSPYYT